MLFEPVVPAFYPNTTTNPHLYKWVNGGQPFGFIGTPSAADVLTLDASGAFANVGPHVPIPTGGVIPSTWHQDFHFRLWTIPGALSLSNPTLNSDIPFNIWNTFDRVGVLNAVNVQGSSVLTFDYSPPETIDVFEFKLVNLQIGPGEPTIDATITFSHDLGDAVLLLKAVVAETFPLLPEVPVSETWEWKTDILRTYDGTEMRIALRDEPRVSMNFKVKIIDFEERRILYNLTSSSIRVPAVIPMFQYAAPILQPSAIGDTRLYFDPAMTNLRVGKSLILMNRATREVQLGSVTQLHADGATINTALGLEVNPGLWFVVPGISSFLEDDSGLDFGTVVGEYTLSSFALENWDLQRPGSTQTVATFDGLPVIEKPFLVTEPERFAYRREVLDNEVGAREIRSRDKEIDVRRQVKFSISRSSDEFDYWREFFALVRGAQRPFLLETQLPDLTLRVAHGDGAAQLEIKETYYEAKLFPYDTFKRLKIRYSDGTFTYHVVTATATNSNNETTISISPALTAGKTVERISFLQKVRASDTVSIDHFNDYSILKFGAKTT